MTAAKVDAQRIDKWLWCARFFRTRQEAAQAVLNGRVKTLRAGRIARVEKPSAQVRCGDRLAILRQGSVIEVMVTQVAARRGSPIEAALLYSATELISGAAPDRLAR